MGGVDNDQIARSNQIAVGKDDELGLVNEIYENKPETEPAAPANPGAADNSEQGSEVTPLGDAGKNALGEIIKPDPKTFGTRSGYLYEAYRAGLNGADLSQELRDSAAAGNFLDEIEKMYKAGETDAKIAKGDTVAVSDENTVVPDMGAAPNADTAGSGSDYTGDYQITDSEKELNYMMDMLFINGAGSSSDPSPFSALPRPLDCISSAGRSPPRKRPAAIPTASSSRVASVVLISGKRSSSRARIWERGLSGTYTTRRQPAACRPSQTPSAQMETPVVISTPSPSAYHDRAN
jgi:hypothetical protein